MTALQRAVFVFYAYTETKGAGNGILRTVANRKHQLSWWYAQALEEYNTDTAL